MTTNRCFRWRRWAVLLLLMGFFPAQLKADGETHATVITLALAAGGKAAYDASKYNELAAENEDLSSEYQTTTSSARRSEIEATYQNNQDQMEQLDKQIQIADQLTLGLVGIEVFLLIKDGLSASFSDNRPIKPYIGPKGAGVQFSWRFP